jgi:hypothetical protein
VWQIIPVLLADTGRNLVELEARLRLLSLDAVIGVHFRLWSHWTRNQTLETWILSLQLTKQTTMG